MTARSIMTEDPVCCRPNTSLVEVARMMVDYDCGEIPVVDDANMSPIGAVTDRDITTRTVAQGKNPLQLTAADCMTSPCIVATADTDLMECFRLMEEHQLRRLLIV